jgi:multiple sugar transport system substrate-binding protein
MAKYLRITLLSVLIVALLPVTVINGTLAAAQDPVTVQFWTAPNPNQEAYWAGVVEEWNASHPDIQIEWQPIPTGASSEEVILNAIATGTAPDISTNIFAGFAAQMAESGAAVALNEEFADFWDVAEGHQMRSIIEAGWGLGGNYYVLPLYSNAMQYWWNLDYLEEAGFEGPPRTYSDVVKLAEAIAVPDERYVIGFPSPKNWWDRWFGYLTLYYAANGGAPYLDLENGEVLFDNEAGYGVAAFMDEMFANGWAPTDPELVDPLQSGVVAGYVMGPWSIQPTAENFPDFRYVVAPPPVPDDYPADAPVYTFADTKGMIMFAQSDAKAEAWEFIKWYYGDIQHDLAWLEATGMPPVREDLMTNEVFAAYWEANPVAAAYASQVPYGVPPALSSATIPIQRLMGREMIEPIWRQELLPDEAVDAGAAAIEDFLALGM